VVDTVAAVHVRWCDGGVSCRQWGGRRRRGIGLATGPRGVAPAPVRPGPRNDRTPVTRLGRRRRRFKTRAFRGDACRWCEPAAARGRRSCGAQLAARGSDNPASPNHVNT
jgi:hypothetical protein